MRSIFSFILFVLVLACSGIKESQEAPTGDAIAYGFPEPRLAPDRPYEVLPGRKIPKDKYRLLPSIDTVRMDYVYYRFKDQVIIFKPDSDEFRQEIAVKRASDWLMLDWSLFRLTAPAGLTASYLDVNGKGSLELLLSHDRIKENEQQQSIHGSSTDEKGNEYFTNEVWKKSRGFCIVDLDSISFMADNVFTGYEYYYQTDLRFDEKRKKEGREYTVSGTKNHYRTTFRVWYNFEIMPKENLIMVTLEKCEYEKTLDKAKSYFSDPSEENEEPDPETEELVQICTPIYAPGLYEFKDGAFRLQQ